MEFFIKTKKKIFSEEIVNSGRQPELDMAKAAVIVCLAWIHCIIECTPEEGLTTGIPYVFDTIIGGPLAAPMFMFAMGIGMVYTKTHTPNDYIRRGIRLWILSYVLNICRFVIPFLAGYLITGEYEHYIGMMPYWALGNDILQFAGLAMLFLDLLLKLRLSKAGLFLTALLMSAAAVFLNGIDVGSPAGNIFLGYLMGTEDAAGKVASDFPLFNWFIVPVCGYLFGDVLRHVKDKKMFYGIFSSICGAAALVYFIIGIHFKLGMFGEGENCYYHITTWDTAASLAAAVGILGVYHVILRHIPGKVMGVVSMISRNINAIYCIHWVLLSWIVMVGLYAARGTQELPVLVTLLLGSGIIVVSIFIAYFWSSRWKNKLLGGFHEKK